MSPEVTDASSLVGRVIQDRFRILQRIASGGMGTVYLAEQLPLGRKVALKVLEIAPENLAGRAQFQERFFLEAAAVAKLSHPNTIVLYDYGRTDDGLYYYAMELIEGITLSKLIKKSGGLEPALAVHIATQICGSLREAHELGLVHRDLKPGNVMLTRRGDDNHFVKVLDFGLVKVIGDGEAGADLTRSGIVMGSPRYMAPEQVESRHVDHRADIYAFGTVLYHMLAGKPPFLYPSQFETLRAQVDETPPPLEAKNPFCQAGPELRALLYQCLEKSPDRRPQSMSEIAQRLKACAMEIGISVPSISSVDVARLAGRPTPLPAEASSSEPELDYAPTMASTPSAHALRRQSTAPSTESAAEQATPERKRSWAMPIAALLVAGVVAGVAAFLLPADKPPAAAPPPIAIPIAPSPPEPATPEAPPPVELVSDPPGARVKHGEADLGDAPLSLPIPEGERWELTLSLDGYEPRTITVTAGRPTVNVRLTPVAPPAEPEPAPSRARSRASKRREPRPEVLPVPQPQPLPAPEPAPVWTPRSDNRDPWAQ